VECCVVTFAVTQMLHGFVGTPPERPAGALIDGKRIEAERRQYRRDRCIFRAVRPRLMEKEDERSSRRTGTIIVGKDRDVVACGEGDGRGAALRRQGSNWRNEPCEKQQDAHYTNLHPPSIVIEERGRLANATSRRERTTG